MIVFITYSNELYSKSRDFCAKMALKKGKVDKAIVYKPEDIDKKFREDNKEILDIITGNGLWLWKSYFVYKSLNEANDGDVVIYCDAGSFFYRSCKDIIASMDDDIWVSNISLIEKQYTKPELFEYMLCTDSSYTDTNQFQSNFIVIRKTDRGMKFAKEWFDICSKGVTLTRDTIYQKEKPNFKYFCHRSDQSVLSLLSKKWDLKAHLDPSQYGRVPEKYYAANRIFKKTSNFGEYKPCIILHRGRKPKLKVCLSQWILTWLPLFIVHRISKPCKSINKEIL